MPVRLRRRSARWSVRHWLPARLRRAQVLAVMLAAALTANALMVPPAVAAETPPSWAAPKEPSIPGTKMGMRPSTPDRAEQSAVRGPRKVEWPAATVAEVDLAPAATGARAMPSGRVRAGDSPITLGAPANRETGLRTSANGPSRVGVQVLDRGATAKAKVDGVLVRLRSADAARSAGRISVQVDYRSFGHAFGGDWAARLHMVALPECALITPDHADCQGRPLPSTNNTSSATLAADVDLTSTAPALLGIMAADSGASGSYSATPLASASTWSHGGSSGDFNWSYPLRVPPGVNGPTPQISLSYSSGSVDGRTVSTNNQPSWLGEGFEFWPGLVERKYKPCALDTDQQNNQLPNNTTRPTGDQCWGTNNGTISLNGKAGELVPVDAQGTTWRMKNDDGTRIQRLLDTGRGNGDADGEYWVATTPDGTRYYFGYNRLPGYTGASGQETTDSAWTVPVYGNHPNEPGYTTGNFAASERNQAWRWNLDYVVDIHGNTMSYFYGTETNRYARNGDVNSAAAYTRGGYLKRIDYGQRDNQIYSTKPVAQVEFEALDRCTPNTACDFAHPNSWPDTPVDQNCSAAPCNGHFSPTFWTQKRLAKITTKVREGASAFRLVDSWTLSHLFADPGDFTRAGLWLDRISHTGHVAPAGQEITLPDVKFTGEPYNNRVDAATADYVAPHNWWRVTAVQDENGGKIAVVYENPDCVASGGMPASPETNTRRCQPVRWSPDPSLPERLDWFHKYVVRSVSQSDELAGTVPVETHYQYLDGAAWHYDEVDGLTPAEEKTWGQWRGYGRVKTRTGNPTDGQLVTETRYFRGMDGDRNGTGGQKNVWVADSRGAGFEWEDHERLAGTVRENITWLVDDTTMLSRTITDPWISPATATSTKPWGTTRSFLLDTAASLTRAAVEGGWRDSSTTKTIEADGTVTSINSKPQAGKPEFDRCTRYEYVSNTTAHLIDLPKRVETVTKACETPPSRPADVISDALSYYDGIETHGAQPTEGQVTRVDEFDGWNAAQSHAIYRTVSRATYDDLHGRMTASTDAKGGVTETEYTPESGGPVTAVKTINPLLHDTQAFLDPAFGAQIGSVDANGLRTDLKLDALGRLSKVWSPGRTMGTHNPDAEFSYLIRTDGPDVITTKRLQPDGGYQTKYELYDGLARLRQTQVPAPGGGRAISDMIHDSRGLLVKRRGPYYNAAAPAFEVMAISDDAVASQVRTVYDTAGRATNEITIANGAERWRTTTTYTGLNRIDVDPPAGGTASTTITDARGATTTLRQYKGPSPTGAYDETRYTYTNKGQLATVTDAAQNGGNTWQYFYDMLGRLDRTEDPDRGTTTITYTPYGEKKTVTNEAGDTLAYVYDILGRTTSLRDDDVTGTMRAGWVYDTIHKGMPTSSTRYVGSDQWTNRVVDYDDTTGRPTGSEVVVPASEGSLAGTYRFDATYLPDGSPATVKMPAAGGLAEETLTYGYNAFGLPTTLTGTTSSGTRTYVNTSTYTSFAELSVIGRTTNDAKWVKQEFFYEPGTRRLQGGRISTRTAGATAFLSNTAYSYDDAGNLQKISDTPVSGTADHQCFDYDYLNRLTQAWTPGNGDCDATPTTAALAGPATYWTSWTFDEAGNRTSETSRAISGTTTSTYTYPSPGQPQPHTLTQVQTQGPAGNKTVNYGYDALGNTTTRPGTGTGTQTLTWDPEGRLATIQEGATTSTYVYGASGNRIKRKDGNTTTIYLPGMELTSTGGVTKTAIRYYTHAGQPVAVRTNDNKLTWLLADHHGTNSLTVDETTQAIQRRYSTPFGGTRGTQPTAWPDDKGFVGGSKDNSGLTHLGAREYDPQTGRFISVDPIIDPGDPQQMHGYAYANNAPTTLTDPDGLKPACSADGTAASEAACNGSGGSAPTTDTTTDTDTTTPAQLDQVVEDAKADKERAEAVKKKSFLDIIKEQGLAFLLDFFGITDIINCFTKGDIGACVNTLVGMIPWGKVFKAGKSLYKGIKRAFASYKSWQNAIRLADDAIARADEAIALAQQKATELREALAKIETAAGELCENNSFVSGTRVLMADGTGKPIEEVRVGDEVAATDPETGDSGTRTVTKEIVGAGDKRLVKITVDTDGGTGDASATLTATDAHPIWVANTTRWTNAADLQPGDDVLTPDGARVRVIDIAAYGALATVYNLTVEDIHTYYVVAGNTPVLVHNCGGNLTVHKWAADEPGGVPHFSVEVVADSGGGTRHTELLGGTGTPASVRDFNSVGMTLVESRTIRISNAAAAINFQRRAVMTGRAGSYDVITNSCVTHCMNVAAKGGVQSAGVRDFAAHFGWSYKDLRR
ncbi:polymorphic toxin-type HINT domain-containing protein [Micromonospora sp. NBC_01796]|uniref:polymorphic toxin-type HINT domain-containing protein n=1 Tax=Micromonospora sp. NBC_01796 TaxID=2975987 RepID=UPI002DD8D953|nr:polymorphic toxin-type HINT domain-containing protein [Micromonospora sp. NBC_01796]WSA83881.1 polymorphic toxin-type HINT domain-containing protein [Micromonospora sp. NBC_01796]